MKLPAVYLLVSGRRGPFYVGVTSDLIARTSQLREDVTNGFTSRYEVKSLVWHEQHQRMIDATGREKAIKKWNPQRKIGFRGNDVSRRSTPPVPSDE